MFGIFLSPFLSVLVMDAVSAMKIDLYLLKDGRLIRIFEREKTLFCDDFRGTLPLISGGNLE